MIKNKKACLSVKQGSILAYSLIIITVMISIAVSISVSSIAEKKAASSTQFSMQSIQTADTGAQLAIKSLNGASSGFISTALAGLGGSCNGSKYISPNDTSAGPIGSQFELTFFDDSVPEIKLACNDDVNDLAKIKSIGTYKDTVRAVEVMVGGKCPGIMVAKRDIAAEKLWYDAGISLLCNTEKCLENGKQAGNRLRVDNRIDFSRFPAQQACKTYDEAGDWRLPDINELDCIYRNRNYFDNDGAFNTTGNYMYFSNTDYGHPDAVVDVIPYELSFKFAGSINIQHIWVSGYTRCVQDDPELWKEGSCAGMKVSAEDISVKKMWKNSNTVCSTPQCRIDGGQVDNLTPYNSPKDRGGAIVKQVSFTDYPARDACKKIGARLPTKDELGCMRTNASEYGGFQSAYYWSAEEKDATTASVIKFGDVSAPSSTSKNTLQNVRCVR